MSGECNNCETRQRIGKDARCLVCIYFNANIFGTGIGPSETEVYNAKVLEEIKAKRKQAKINKNFKANKSVKDVIKDTYKYSKSFNDILKEKYNYWQDIGIDSEALFGIKDNNKFDDSNEPKSWFYFTFPNSVKLRGKYVKFYGTANSTKLKVEQRYPNEDYIQHDHIEWNTPTKYARRKPSDCYTEWI